MTTAPTPAPDVLTEPFWRGGTDGELRVQRCEGCGHLRFPPSPVCPRCLDERATWVPTTGRGTILSYVVFHRAYQAAWANRVPYAVLLVQLDDGPRLFSDYAGSPGDLAVGARVRAGFVPMGGGFARPRFELDA